MSDQKTKYAHDNFMTPVLKIGWFFLGLAVTALIFYILDQTPTVRYITFTYLIALIIAVADWATNKKGGDDQ